MKYVVVGGGIAGVNCAMGILRLDNSDKTRVTLISATDHIKTISNWYKIGQFTEFFDVNQEAGTSITDDVRFQFKLGEVVRWSEKTLNLRSGETVNYDKLCIATGARAISPWQNVLTLRDTDSAVTLQDRLRTAHHVAIVGNGGIGMELAYELTCKISWLIRDDHIGAKFFPKSVEPFLLEHFLRGRASGSKTEGVQKRLKYTSDDVTGAALGPDWSTAVNLRHGYDRELNILYNSTVNDVSQEANGSFCITYNHDEKLQCDLVIWAAGVTPNSDPWRSMVATTSDGEIEVDDVMRTSVPGVFACGDVSRIRTSNDRQLWKQMRLWTQARQQGDVCAHSMVYGEEARDTHMYFDLFTHCTTFFGMKVVFLGDYKPEHQTAGEWRIVERIVGNVEYVRCVVSNDRVVGALLIGETEQEEVMENLILNQTDISGMEQDILDPNFELDDYFD